MKVITVLESEFFQVHEDLKKRHVAILRCVQIDGTRDGRVYRLVIKE